jgi:hypothetical protein
MAFHQPHASCSLAREYTSISWFSVKSGFPGTPSGGRRTWENGNFDSGCQLKNKLIFYNNTKVKENYFMFTFFLFQNMVYTIHYHDQNECTIKSSKQNRTHVTNIRYYLLIFKGY